MLSEECQGHCQVVDVLGALGSPDPTAAAPVAGSGGGGQSDDFVPGGESGIHLAAVVLGGEQVAAGPEVR